MIMKVVKANRLLSNTALQQYKANVNKLIDQFANAGALLPLVSIYGLTELHNAVNALYYNGECICTPSGTKSGIILKTLELGGFGLPALHILTRAGGSL